MTYSEAVDKIEYLKEEYRAHLKASGLKARLVTIRTFVVGFADLIESVLKLKLKTVAESPFKVLDARFELLKAEREAPGRELGYIVRASDAFTRRTGR